MTTLEKKIPINKPSISALEISYVNDAIANGWGELGAVALITLFAVSLCWVSVLIGMLARSSGAVQGLSFLIVFPLTFGSSTFVPADSLPG